MPDFPNINFGEIDLPTAAPTDASFEDAPIAAVSEDLHDSHEPMTDDSEAQTYFDSVDEGEALNYISFLHDIHAITFDRFTELKEKLGTTPTFLP